MQVIGEKIGWMLLAATLVRTGEDAHDEIFLSSRWYHNLKDLLQMCLEDDTGAERTYVKGKPSRSARLWTGKEGQLC